MRNYTKKGTNAENFMQISLLLKKIWYLKDSRNGHFAMHYSSFLEKFNGEILCICNDLKSAYGAISEEHNIDIFGAKHITTRPDDVWRIFDCSKHKH